MSDAAPPAWVLALDIASGAWRCLVGLWTFAEYGTTGPTIVWPSRETLAAHTGQKPATVAKQLRKLAELGLLTRLDGSKVRLAWLAPTTTVAGPTTTVSDDHSRTPDDPGIRPDDHSIRPPTTTVVPNLQGPSNLPSKNVAVDARPTSGKPAPFHSRCHGGGSFSCPGYRGFCGSCNEASRLAHRAARIGPVDVIERDGKPANGELPGHVEAKLARAKREQAPGAIDRAELLADAHGFSPELLARIEATSQAAYVALMTSGCTTHVEGGKCWAALLAKNILDRGLTDDQVIRVLEHWEQARKLERPKPPMGKLWWWGQATSAFVDEALGADSQPAQPRKPMQPARVKVKLATPSWAPKSALAGGQP